jgi:dTDP-glucose 4,6-dehydratase
VKKILVAGGAGFIGSHLCERLVSNNKVICIDNLITGSKNNIKHLLSNSNFEYLEYDISSNEFLDNIKLKDLDEIYNLASPASPIDYLQHPIETLKVGSVGSSNLLELARLLKSKILFASTSEVYGDPLEHPQKEEYWGNVNPVGVRSCYDEAKRFMEALAVAYKRVYKLDIRIARIFNTYGPRMRLDDGRVVPNFVSQAIKGEPLSIYGDGKQTRSFCYVSDLVDGLVKLMLSDIDTPVNLGNPEERTIIDFADAVIKITKTKLEFNYQNIPEDDPKKRKPDISKAKKHLDWEPVVSLEEGLSSTIEYFRDIIDEV